MAGRIIPKWGGVRRPGRALGAIIFFGVMAVVALGIALCVGSVAVTPLAVWRALTGDPARDLTAEIVLRLRLPRALSAFATGAVLTLSGTLLQVLVRNPLAEPYLLGVSGGAAVAALAALNSGGFNLHIAAGMGALFSTVLVLGLAGTNNPMRLALTGAAIAAGWGALISLILIISPTANLRGMLFWLMGDFGTAQEPRRVWIILIFGFSAAMFIAPRLNLLARGVLTAATLGVAVRRLRLGLYLLSSLLVATAVIEAGTIGFVGLIAPHLARLAFGADHRLVIPIATLFGGTLLLVADTVARTVISPRELPVGIITALIGAPVFLILIRRGVIYRD